MGWFRRRLPQPSQRLVKISSGDFISRSLASLVLDSPFISALLIAHPPRTTCFFPIPTNPLVFFFVLPALNHVNVTLSVAKKKCPRGRH